MGYSPIPPQAYTSVLKFTIDGRPSVKDIHDLFSALITQLNFSTHRYMFRTYTNSFTSEDALERLSSLQFNKSTDDQGAQSRNITRITTTTFNMNRDMAKALIQQFIWTRLMESSFDPTNRTYKDKGIWRLTSKGLCILQDFCLKNGIDWEQFISVVNVTSQLMFLIQVERLSENDRISCKRKHISSLFVMMIASLPLRQNRQSESNKIAGYHQSHTRSLQDNGLDDTHSVYSHDSDSTSSPLSTRSSRQPQFFDYFPDATTLPNDLLVGTGLKQPHQNNKVIFQQHKALLQNLNLTYNRFRMRAIFTSFLCCTWLIENCTFASTDEVEGLLTDFLNMGWVDFYNKKDKELGYVESSKSILLNMTREGINVVMDYARKRYNEFQQKVEGQFNSIATLETRLSTVSLTSEEIYSEPHHQLTPSDSIRIHSNISTPPLTPTTPATSTSDICSIKEGNSCRLQSILRNSQLRSIFKDFLANNFCVENLNFWIDHDNLRRNYQRQKTNMTSNSQRLLLEDAYTLWNAYLKPGAAHELNIDHNTREQMTEEISYMASIVHTYSLGNSTKPKVVMLAHATYANLMTILNWLERVNEQICKLMATDSIPKFVRTAEYKQVVRSLDIAPMQLKQKKPEKLSIVTKDIYDFPSPPQRKVKETIYL
ncbi:regulator of G protein signaling domain-containing protein [Mycotypha africana]|uniref:regulator of G protein signaling domain-containing protein n=1 Tax=Mycotypha africana TaxID=64632 RepID=UPI0023018198|nr:regulator of G protein signaling domain-containing protein [Mycotypha africana]KAI8990943.1 regulator of G protein signaling domain-containing protein [Mycotypha africana]